MRLSSETDLGRNIWSVEKRIKEREVVRKKKRQEHRRSLTVSQQKLKSTLKG